MHPKLLLLSVTLLFLLASFGESQATIAGAETIVFARYPAPSPDGATLAFCWAGDIWTVPIDGGRSTRLTASEGYDRRPIWSPDGARIAFMSDRYGSEDLFITDARGGTPERITFSSNGDLLSGWTPDGSALLFSSRRGGPWPNHREPHTVDLQASRGEGPGTPRQLIPCAGLGAVIHPDGETVAFTFGPAHSYREGYHGARKEDIWLYSLPNETFTRITENDVHNTDPQWSADESKLYFRSEISGAGNLWSLNPATGEMNQLTHLSETGLWNPRIGGPAGSEVFAYEWRGGIWAQDLPDGEPSEIRITAWLDEDPDTPEAIVRTSDATEYTISPDGAEMAFVVRGEIFCVRADGIGGVEAARLTDHPARDWEIAWYPRGDAILFTSDRDGVEQLYRASSDDPEHERLSESRRFAIERLTRTDEACTAAVIAPTPPTSPDDESPPEPSRVTVAYVRNTGNLWLMDGDGANQRRLFTHWGTLNYSFSPDGRWLAYSRQDDEYNIDIFIAAVDPDDPDLPSCPYEGWQPFPGGRDATGLVPSWADGEVNITRHPHDDFYPVWSPDGTKLGFTSERRMGNTDAYFVFLRQSDEERSLAEWELAAEPLPALPAIEQEPEEEEEVEEEEAEEEPFVVEIDFEDIHRRARRLTSLSGREIFWAFSPDGETVAYYSDSDGVPDVWQMSWTGEDVVRLSNNADPGSITWPASADRIFYLSKGGIHSNKPGGGDSQAHGFSARLMVDPLAERSYKFNEVWRLQDRWFYDPDFHGRDWAALHDEYEPIALAARHYRDFNDAVNMMIGRINSSHIYYGDAERGPSGPETGYLGCGLVEDGEPGLLVSWVTPNSPVDEVEVGLDPGDRIISINGVDVGGWGDAPVGNWWPTLEGTVGREIELGILHGEETEPRWVRATPTDYWGWYMLAYEDWMAENRRVVEELSGGRLGYMHIRSMWDEPMERFEQDLYTVGHGKEGIIIDVRWNSGGWTTDYMLAMLDTRRHALTQPRDGGLGYPEDRTPFYTTVLPLVAMCNQWSYSNAEIFSHAIQRLERGPLVGWPTGGGVISTGSTRLADGSYVSLPRRGWWSIDPDTKEILFNLEGHAAEPDVLIDLLPPDIAAGENPQLVKAVETLLDLVSERP